MSGIVADSDDRAAGLPITPGQEWLRAYGKLAIYLGVAAAMLLPLLCATVPPLVDYPDHLARMWILLHQAAIPELARNYVVNWRILPDMAMDLVIPALAQFMPVTAAGRIFIGLTIVGLVAGTATLHRVLHGRFSLWPIFCVLFVYNAVLFWGFLSCLFAIAVYLFALGGWIASRNWRLFPRILLFSLVAALLFLLHAFAFGLYGLSVASYEFARRIDARRLPLKLLVSYILVCLQFLPGLALWYISLGNVRSAYTSYGDIASKFYAVLAPVTFGVEPAPLDRIACLAVAGISMLLLAKGALKFAPQMRVPLGAMVLVAVLMPNVANGSWLADIRLPVVLPFVVIASTSIAIDRKQLKIGLGATALILFGLRIWAVSQSWSDYDRWFGEFRQASAAMVPGSRLLIVENSSPNEPAPLPSVPLALASIQPPVFWHMGALAVIDRSAFFPYLFTGAATVDASPANQSVAQTVGAPISPDELIKSADPSTAKALYTQPDRYGQLPYWRDWPRSFDYLLWIDITGTPKPVVPGLSRISGGGIFDLYKIGTDGAAR